MPYQTDGAQPSAPTRVTPPDELNTDRAKLLAAMQRAIRILCPDERLTVRWAPPATTDQQPGEGAHDE